MASGLPPLHGRHRSKKGEVSQKHGNTLIGTMRKTYGQHFATRCDDAEKVSDVLHRMDEQSLMELVLDTPGA